MLQTTHVQKTYVGNSSATALPIDFNFLSNDQITVEYILIATGVAATFVEGVDYTLTGGNPATHVTLTIAHASTHKVVITRETDITQATDLTVNTTYITQSLENALDKQAMISQEIDFRAGNYIASDAAVAALAAQVTALMAASLHTTGDAKLTYKVVADAGWVLANDGSIGSLSSGATNRANADTEPLYALLWGNISNTYCPVSTGRGASAAADFAANKTLTLSRLMGRALMIAGAGASLTNRTLGQYLGTETHTLVTGEMPAHTHIQDAHTHIQDSHTHAVFMPTANESLSQSYLDCSDASTNTVTGGTVAVNQNTTAVNQNAGGGAAHANMQPSGALNLMIKL